jgi:hypothetical protein
MRRSYPLLPLLLLAGCGVERTLTVRSDPPGALVYLNGEEAGRTPMHKTFLWYGTYDVQVRKEGYVTKSDKTKVWAPWWQIPPIDLLAELVPLKLQDNHVVEYTLRQETEEQTDPEQVIDRGVRLRRRLRSSKNTREPVETPDPANDKTSLDQVRQTQE